MPFDRKAERWLLYDGECPFCTRYVAFLRLQQAIGPVKLIDAREGGPELEEVRAAGFDIDEGMALKLNGRIYHGADCIHVLALSSTRSGMFNRVNTAIFSSPRLSRMLYPALRSMRNVTLRGLGREPINNAEVAKPH